MKKIIFVIIILVISIFVYVNVNAEIIIPNDAIRVRVVPNSNSVIDQNMKEKVSNYVSNYMILKLDGVTDLEKARNIINDSLDEINANIKDMFIQGVKDNHIKLKRPDITLFLIIEFVSSSLYSVATKRVEMDINLYKTYIHKTIKNLINDTY